MSELTPVTAPKMGVNDGEITIMEHLVAERTQVQAGTPVLSAETSKTSFEVESPEDGFVHHLTQPGDDVPADSVLCLVGKTLESLDGAPAHSRVPESVEGQTQAAASPAPSLSGAQASVVSVAVPEAEDGVAVTLSEWLCTNDTAVAEGQAIFRAVVGERTVDVAAPRSGVLRQLVEPLACAAASSPLALIGDTIQAVELFSRSQLCPEPVVGPVRQSGASAPARPAPCSVRFTQSALELLTAKGLSEGQFSGQGLVRTVDVLRALGEVPAQAAPAVRTPAVGERPQIPFDDVPVTAKKLSRAKRTEIQRLTASARSAVTSQISRLVPSKGVFAKHAGHPGVVGRMSSRIVFECAQLLRTYPYLNARYEPDHAVLYEQLNIGFAVDAGLGLKVPVVHQADQLTFNALLERKEDMIARYLDGQLTQDDLVGGTFTITDLSEQQSWLFNPIINYGQSAILGVGGELHLGGGRYVYPLVLAFDHRLGDGAMAAAFLGELSQRLAAYETVLLRELGLLQASDPTLICCQQCMKTLEDITERGRLLLKTIGRDGSERLICSTCAQGW